MNQLLGARQPACWVLPLSLILSPTLALAQSEPGHDAHPPGHGAVAPEHAAAEAGHAASEHTAPAEHGAAEHGPARQAPAEHVPAEQDAPEPAGGDDAAPSEDVEEIVVGSRRPTRSKLDATTPVDKIDVSEFRNQSAPDMGTMLRTIVPSFNVNQQPISDAATMMRPANLRGLPPDNTIVLVNGKRRHRGSVIAF